MCEVCTEEERENMLQFIKHFVTLPYYLSIYFIERVIRTIELCHREGESWESQMMQHFI